MDAYGTARLAAKDAGSAIVARIVSIHPDGVVQTRVLPGPTREHRRLVSTSSAA
jgi:hypothetical protein